MLYDVFKDMKLNSVVKSKEMVFTAGKRSCRCGGLDTLGGIPPKRCLDKTLILTPACPTVQHSNGTAPLLEVMLQLEQKWLLPLIDKLTASLPLDFTSPFDCNPSWLTWSFKNESLKTS